MSYQLSNIKRVVGRFFPDFYTDLWCTSAAVNILQYPMNETDLW